MYAILFIIFVSLFSFEMTKTNTSSTTTIVSSPPSPASDNIVCTPLATFSGSTDVQCEASPGKAREHTIHTVASFLTNNTQFSPTPIGSTPRTTHTVRVRMVS